MLVAGLAGLVSAGVTSLAVYEIITINTASERLDGYSFGTVSYIPKPGVILPAIGGVLLVIAAALSLKPRRVL